ncbi:MAG TPA: YicC family protein [Ignavibacteriales bacterium]|nr:YicC family protein [Ignavibacteriales bacterium]HRR18093.1 YicC family protein [Ignavibacteriales bacterium]HRT98156.1 YicC family protein [Ignavibacteriales bacterium]
MIKSLTGFGCSQIESERFKVSIEIKSINSKVLDTNIILPKSLFGLELELNDILKKHITKGKVSSKIKIDKKIIKDEIRLNETEAKYYYTLLEKLKSTLGLNDTIKLEHLLEFKDIFYNDEDENTTQEVSALVKNCFEKAVLDLVKSKETEGKRLIEDISLRLKNIKKLYKNFEEQNKKSVEEKFDRLKTRVQNLLQSYSLNEDRLYLELAILVDKADITEELVRLESHIKFCEETIKSNNEVSKRLLFITQEMQREVNTISNKTESKDILKNVVLIKEEIEKIKEQLANIE